MATNPYITVPGGPEWMQKLWLAQYMQNQDLQTKYNFAQSQQPSPWATVAAGVGKGLYSGLDSYFDQRDKQNLLSQQTGSQLMLQSSRDQAAQQAQDAVMQRLMEADRLKQTAADAERERKSQAFSQFLQARTPQTMMLPGAPTTRQDFSGGAEPPVMQSPAAPDSWQYLADPSLQLPPDGGPSPVEQSPETYAGSLTTQGAPSLRQMPGLDVIQSLASVDPNLVGYLMNPEILKELNAQDAKGQMKPAEVTARLNAYREAVAAGALDPAIASRQLAADTGIQIDLSKPVALQEAELKLREQQRALSGQNPAVSSDRAGAGVAGLGAILPDLTKSPLANALPGIATLIAIARAPDGSPILQDPAAAVMGNTPDEIRAHAALTLKEQYKYDVGIRSAEAVAGVQAQDLRQRAQQADEARRDFTTLLTVVPQIQQRISGLLQPGIGGRLEGLAKTKLQDLLQAYPETQELVSFGESIKGAVSRRVLLESGMLSTFDVTRTDALIPKRSDNLETGMAKLRVLSTYLDASMKAWDAYERSGLYLNGQPATRGINDFLPQNFWDNALRTATNAGPGGPWKKD